MARLTGLEPATPGVTGRYSNQLSYNRAMRGYLRPTPGGRNGGNAKISWRPADFCKAAATAKTRGKAMPVPPPIEENPSGCAG